MATEPEIPASLRDPLAICQCWSCKRDLEARDPYCRWCGKRQVASGEWYFRPLGIILLTLTVAGPLTLPLVWKSPLLSPRQRWWLSVFIAGVTVLVVLMAWWTYVASQRMLTEILG